MDSLNGSKDEKIVNGDASNGVCNGNGIDRISNGNNDMNGHIQNNGTRRTSDRRKKIVVVGLGMVALSFM